MRRGGAPGKDGEGEKVMGPLFPRLHVNDTTLKGGGPRAPPRNKMALYEQFSVPSSQRFAPAQAHRPAAASASATASYAVSSASAGQIGGNGRPLFPSFGVPSNEPVRPSQHFNTTSSARDGSATRAESGRLSTQQLKSKDTHAAGSTAECSSQRRENNTRSATGKKLNNDDDFTVPSVFCSGGVPPQPAREEVRIQEKSTPFPMYKSGPAMSKSSAKHSNADKRNLEGVNASDKRSRDSSSIRDKAPAKMTTTNLLEIGDRSSPFKYFSTEKTGKSDDKVSSYKDKLSSINVSDKQHSQTGGHQARRTENAAESQNVSKAGNVSNIMEKGLRETAEKRKRSTGHNDVQKDDSSDDSSVEYLPGLEISPDDVVGAIGPKHFWKARRAIVNQQRVFAVQVFELHRLIKVQKLIAASPHLLIEGDPCLGTALVTSKKKLAAAKVLPPARSKDDDDDDAAQLTLQQAEHKDYSRENTEGGNQTASLSQDDDDDVVEEVQNNNNNDNNYDNNQAAASNGGNPPATMPAPPDNNNNNNKWCAPPQPPNQWLVPVMSPSEGLVYKPYAGPCPPAGSFLAPFYASSIPSMPGDFMASPYGMPMPHHHQPQHMGGPPPMPPMYFPPFSMRVMNNPAVSASAVEQVTRAAPARPTAEHLSRTSCNMRNEAVSGGGIWRFHPSARDSELQGSSAASSPFDRQQQQQGEARAAPPPPPLPTSSAGPQPSSGGSKENLAARVIRVVPHTARTASESAARIFRSIQMERQQNDP